MKTTWRLPASVRTDFTNINEVLMRANINEAVLYWKWKLPWDCRQQWARTWRPACRSRSDAGTTAALNTVGTQLRFSQTAVALGRTRTSRGRSQQSSRSQEPSWPQFGTEPEVWKKKKKKKVEIIITKCGNGCYKMWKWLRQNVEMVTTNV